MQNLIPYSELGIASASTNDASENLDLVPRTRARTQPAKARATLSDKFAARRPFSASRRLDFATWSWVTGTTRDLRPGVFNWRGLTHGSHLFPGSQPLSEGLGAVTPQVHLTVDGSSARSQPVVLRLRGGGGSGTESSLSATEQSADSDVEVSSPIDTAKNQRVTWADIVRGGTLKKKEDITSIARVRSSVPKEANDPGGWKDWQPDPLPVEQSTAAGTSAVIDDGPALSEEKGASSLRAGTGAPIGTSAVVGVDAPTFKHTYATITKRGLQQTAEKRPPGENTGGMHRGTSSQTSLLSVAKEGNTSSPPSAAIGSPFGDFHSAASSFGSENSDLDSQAAEANEGPAWKPPLPTLHVHLRSLSVEPPLPSSSLHSEADVYTTPKETMSRAQSSSPTNQESHMGDLQTEAEVQSEPAHQDAAELGMSRKQETAEDGAFQDVDDAVASSPYRGVRHRKSYSALAHPSRRTNSSASSQTIHPATIRVNGRRHDSSRHDSNRSSITDYRDQSAPMLQPHLPRSFIVPRRPVGNPSFPSTVRPSELYPYYTIPRPPYYLPTAGRSYRVSSSPLPTSVVRPPSGAVIGRRFSLPERAGLASRTGHGQQPHKSAVEALRESVFGSSHASVFDSDEQKVQPFPDLVPFHQQLPRRTGPKATTLPGHLPSHVRAVKPCGQAMFEHAVEWRNMRCHDCDP